MSCHERKQLRQKQLFLCTHQQLTSDGWATPLLNVGKTLGIIPFLGFSWMEIVEASNLGPAQRAESAQSTTEVSSRLWFQIFFLAGTHRQNSQRQTARNFAEQLQLSFAAPCFPPWQVCWLVVSTPLKNISQLELLFPIYGKKCSKPLTSMVWGFPGLTTFHHPILGSNMRFSKRISLVRSSSDELIWSPRFIMFIRVPLQQYPLVVYPSLLWKTVDLLKMMIFHSKV